MNENLEKEKTTEEILTEIETIMLEEIKYYANKEQTINAKSQRLNVTDRMVKSCNVVLAVENLKERKYMNRTERKKETRKLSKKQSKQN